MNMNTFVFFGLLVMFTYWRRTCSSKRRAIEVVWRNRVAKAYSVHAARCPRAQDESRPHGFQQPVGPHFELSKFSSTPLRPQTTGLAMSLRNGVSANTEGIATRHSNGNFVQKESDAPMLVQSARKGGA